MGDATVTVYLIRDTMAWWGALAWLISLDDVVRWLLIRPRPQQVRAINPFIATIAMGVLSTGLIILGIAVPLNTRVEMFTGTASAFGLAVASGWTLISLAGWVFVCARAARPGIIIAAAGLALGGMALAAVLTVGAA